MGFPREQAEAQVQLVIDSFQENVATKSALAELKSELKTEMAQMKAGLKSEMADMKTDLVFRLGGLIVVSTGVLGFFIKF